MTLQVSEDHRQQQLALRAVMLRELLKVYPALDVKRLDKTFPQWMDLVMPIIQDHRGYSAVIAQRFVDQMRSDAGADEEWTRPAPRPMDVRRVQAAMYSSAIATMKEAIARKQTERAARDRGFIESAGAATRDALNSGRDVVIDSVQADPVAVGWYRVTDGDPCSFCAMLAASGVRYKTEETASFQAHGNCGCSAAPAYSRDAELPPLSLEAERIYTEATRGFKGKDKINAFRRAWEARNQ